MSPTAVQVCSILSPDNLGFIIIIFIYIPNKLVQSSCALLSPACTRGRNRANVIKRLKLMSFVIGLFDFFVIVLIVRNIYLLRKGTLRYLKVDPLEFLPTYIKRIYKIKEIKFLVYVWGFYLIFMHKKVAHILKNILSKHKLRTIYESLAVLCNITASFL